MTARRSPRAGLTRRAIVQFAAAAPVGLGAPRPATAQRAPVRVGYAMARSGALAAGAQATQEPNYLLWAEMQNAAGGLNVAGSRRPIELIGYDDRTDVETCVRTYEKLMGSDKVDLVLPPYGSNANFAVAPLATRFGYPLLAPTVLSRQLIRMKLPYYFSLLQQAEPMMGALVAVLKAGGVKTATVIYIDDLFGLECHAALTTASRDAGLVILEEKSYPFGVKDLSPVLRTMKDKSPHAFIGLTYPPDTILVSRQSREIGFNPKVFYVGVGTSFPLYRSVMGTGAEGVMGMGSWNPKTSAGAKAYFDAHVKKFGKEPDRWASGAGWAALEILTAAVSHAGLDRKAIRDHVAHTEHDTLLGKIRFSGGENVGTPGTVSQWQQGEFEVVWPTSNATAAMLATKPAWA
ncbi:amino acid ABC transporter substrate-binding protein [Piscinibacter sp. HJYY11]|uniref:amino acid ABC transporter substrate-binding protein n=1 Tax=Piscinibacter sp. HJYY11 TaxID=2801333 RepID=UPI00191EA9B1|nr:amino acid ABC transporter substrate-binding protein [Piscinibacter sp. HJYY11]MBL0726423.1 amino acid ABC transporter substrate-binding protein [Piscinibacter sp. HJYY11]